MRGSSLCVQNHSKEVSFSHKQKSLLTNVNTQRSKCERAKYFMLYSDALCQRKPNHIFRERTWCFVWIASLSMRIYMQTLSPNVFQHFANIFTQQLFFSSGNVAHRMMENLKFAKNLTTFSVLVYPFRLRKISPKENGIHGVLFCPKTLWNDI